MTTLCALEEIQPPPIPNNPPFTAPEGWLATTCELIKTHYKADDTMEARIPPMALVRCSRGGKTRALYEIAHTLTTSNIAALYISFNDFSEVTESDKKDPVGAVCKRIALAALSNRDFTRSSIQFGSLKGKYVSEQQIVDWLGEQGCVLLIDELNILPMNAELAHFLKRNYKS